MIATNRFEYDVSLPPRIVFGWGRRREVGRLVAPQFRRAFFVAGSQTLARSGVIAEVMDNVRQQGLETVPLAEVRREPTVADIDCGVAALRSYHPCPSDVLIAVGGGSAIDWAKAVAGIACQSGDSIAEYLEGIGDRKLSDPILATVALPTTAGTGSEATRNAVIAGSVQNYKKSLRHDGLLPRIALVDPELTLSCPRAVTAHSGMDALTQLIESFVSRRATTFSRALARDGLRSVADALLEAVADGQSVSARQRMSHAALLSGMALANSGLGLAHGVAAALGAHCGIAHGLACAVMLPLAVRLNLPACRDEFSEIGELLAPHDSRSSTAAAESVAETIDRLLVDLEIPRNLSGLGVPREMLPEIASGSRGNSLNGNPVSLTGEQLLSLLEEHW